MMHPFGLGYRQPCSGSMGPDLVSPEAFHPIIELIPERSTEQFTKCIRYSAGIASSIGEGGLGARSALDQIAVRKRNADEPNTSSEVICEEKTNRSVNAWR